MEFAYADGQPTALAAFEATGPRLPRLRAQVSGHYMAMFESGLSFNAHPDLALVRARRGRCWNGQPKNCRNRCPQTAGPPPRCFRPMSGPWSHGVVELYMRGAPGAKSPFTPEDLLEAGIGV